MVLKLCCSGVILVQHSDDLRDNLTCVAKICGVFANNLTCVSVQFDLLCAAL
jgi:hypothetical protein